MKAVIKKYKRPVLVLCFLIFLGVMDYPFLSRLYNDRVQGQAVISYVRFVEDLEQQEREQRLKNARAYNNRLSDGGAAALQDTFQQAGSRGSSAAKGADVLRGAGEENIGIVEIPRIQVSLPLYGDTSGETLQKGAGILEGSSLPVGGENTHTCISAHRGLPGKTMFTSLDLLEEGDLFFLNVLGERLCYRVTGIQTVKPDEVEALAIQPGKDLATLITCTPYGINSHRLYVHGERTELPEEEEGAPREVPAESFWRTWGWVPVNLLLLLWLAVMLFVTGHRRKREEKTLPIKNKETTSQKETIRKTLQIWREKA